MWIWWVFTVGICAWKLGEAFFRPHRMLEWPFFACAMWAYFYGYMAYVAKTSLSEYLGNDISNLGQLMALLCLIGLIAGWSFGMRGSKSVRPDTRSFPYYRIWTAGLFFVFVGSIGSYTVLHSAMSGTMDYQQSSGYWILLFYVGYPGLALMTWSLLKMPRQYRTYLWIISFLALAAFMFPHVLTVRRGPLFPAIIVLLLVPPLALRRSPSPFVFFGSLALAGLAMMLFLQIRHITYNGGTWGEALGEIKLDEALSERVQSAEDNEYINNCQLIGTLFQNGKYQYGSGHMELLWQWVPRAIWKEKPSIGEGSYSFNEMFDDVEKATGFHLLGTGAAPGGVADSFVQYGLLCPLFWFGLSWGIGWVYKRARAGNSARWLFSYVGFICATHWLVSQGFAAAFVPGMYFQVVPIIVLLLFGPIAQVRRVMKRRSVAPETAPPSSEPALP